MIIYWSGTGNSRYCAEYLAGKLGGGALDAFSYIRGGIAGEFISSGPWVFVTPTHGWRLPGIFERFLRSARFNGSKCAYFVMTCGSDIGRAAEYNRRLCAELVLVCMGTRAVVMPENYVAMFPVPGEAEAREIVRRARPALDAASVDIINMTPFAEPRPSALDALKSGPVNYFFTRYMISDRRFTVSDKCVSCGKCAALCPVGGIELDGGRPRWLGGCVHCMACICSCPAGAIEYGRASLGKPRYRCPEG